MAMSVRLPATLEARLEQESRRLGLSKSEFVIDALERMLGFKNPAKLLRVARKATGPAGGSDASSGVSGRFKAKLRAHVSD
jgi:hypothetical protein